MHGSTAQRPAEGKVHGSTAQRPAEGKVHGSTALAAKVQSAGKPSALIYHRDSHRAFSLVTAPLGVLGVEGG